MGHTELSKRENWQTENEEKAGKAEERLYSVFRKAFEGTIYVLHEKPTHLRNLYASVKLSQDVLAKIYNPDIDFSKTKWGVLPDFAIENTISGKILFGEIKRQDGWVEGKSPSAGRGNVHERLCKLFTPGLMSAYRKIGKINTTDILPFWVVFEGDITRDPRRVREITFWFDKYSKNFFMWRPNDSDSELVDHFNKYLKKYLD